MSTWIRWLLCLDRGAELLHRAFRSFRDEVLLAYVEPRARESITAEIYSRAEAYLPAGAIFAQGLFSWEKAILSSARALAPSAPPRGELRHTGL